MKARAAYWLLFAGTVAMFSAAIIWNKHREIGQRDHVRAAERRHAELDRLLTRNRTLLGEQLSPDELRRLRLTHERAQTLRARLSLLEKEGLPSPQPVILPHSVSVADWDFAGKATPRTALISVLWAASRGDLDRLSDLLGFSPGVRTKAEEMFSHLPAAAQLEYGSPEKVVATLLSGSFPRDASAATFGDFEEDGDEASVTLVVAHGDGQARTNTLILVRDAEGWRLLVPSNVLSGYQSILQGNAAPPGADTP